jgi:hypothetical protein
VRDARYAFGRLNMIAEYDDKRVFLRKGLESGDVVTSREFG